MCASCRSRLPVNPRPGSLRDKRRAPGDIRVATSHCWETPCIASPSRPGSCVQLLHLVLRRRPTPWTGLPALPSVGDAGVWRRRHAVFAHVCRSRGRHREAALLKKIPKYRAACALQLCTGRRRRPLACAGSACVHVCGRGNALFEHVFRNCGCHRAAVGLESSSKAYSACAL
jgi:hypothetical protein